jgi:hypothetical protein
MAQTTARLKRDITTKVQAINWGCLKPQAAIGVLA